MLKKPKIFYGWWIAIAFFLISAYVAGIVFYGFTAVLEPIANDFNWSYAQVSIAASLRDLVTVLLAPILGFVIDRFSPRKIMFGGAIVIGLGLLLFSRITSLWMFYGVFIIMSMSLNTCSGVVPMTVVGNWFKRRVSIATGIAVCGSAFGGLLVPVVTGIIAAYGWRTAMVILGLGAWVILLPLSLIIRHKPEQYGYLPDGDTNINIPSGKTSTPARSIGVDTGVRQALKSRAFWHITAALFCNLVATIAVITHVMPYLSSIGIPKTTSSLAASALAMATILGRLCFGWLGDRFEKRWVMAAGFMATILSLLIFGCIPIAGVWLILPFAILFGFGYGGALPMVSVLLLQYFGRARLGSILGINMGITMIGGMIGPPLVGWVFDNFHNYQGAWFALAAVIIVGLVSLITMPATGSKKVKGR